MQILLGILDRFQVFLKNYDYETYSSGQWPNDNQSDFSNDLVQYLDSGSGTLDYSKDCGKGSFQ